MAARQAVWLLSDHARSAPGRGQGQYQLGIHFAANLMAFLQLERFVPAKPF